jgi:hypothetical protein
VSRPLLALTTACLACWALLAAPAVLIGGTTALVCSAAALLICLLPALLTLALGWNMRERGPAYQLGLAAGGTGIRMLAGLGAAAALFFFVPYFDHQPQLFIWVAVFYLLTLGLEIRILLAGLTRPAENAAPFSGEPQRSPAARG